MNVKTATGAAVVALIALTGCSATAIGLAPQQPTVTWNPAPAAVETPTMIEYANERWVGPSRPDAAWIESAVTLICKRTIGGYELNVLPDYFYAEKNTGMLADTAAKYECGDAFDR